jgi:hypothetical protein
MKFYKAIGAIPSARIMSSKEIDQLAALSLRKPVAPANIPVDNKPKPVAKHKGMFEHLIEETIIRNDAEKTTRLFTHLS